MVWHGLAAFDSDQFRATFGKRCLTDLQRRMEHGRMRGNHVLRQLGAKGLCVMVICTDVLCSFFPAGISNFAFTQLYMHHVRCLFF